jgi:hypothetical protein
MHVSASKFDFDKEIKTWSTETSRIDCAIPPWSLLYPGEPSNEMGIFFYIGENADIHKYSLWGTIRNKKKDILYWELFPTPSHAKDFKLKGYKMIIYNNLEFV